MLPDLFVFSYMSSMSMSGYGSKGFCIKYDSHFTTRVLNNLVFSIADTVLLFRVFPEFRFFQLVNAGRS